MSQRQLHEAERGVGSGMCYMPLAARIRDAKTLRSGVSARSCGMEARDEPQRRAKAKLRKAIETWVSVHLNATPYIQSRSRGSGDGEGGTPDALTRGDLSRSWCRKVWLDAEQRRSSERRARDCGVWPGATRDQVGGKKATTTHRCLGNEREKSDHSVVALKPGNAGGAKGVTA